jgi:hypothetical protein
MRIGAAVLAVLAVAGGVAAAPGAAAATASDHCANAGAVKVPGADKQRVDCLDDLSASTLALSDHSDRSDWQTLHSQASKNPPAGAGIQVDGYFPDDSTTNGTHGWNHDSQFVIRLPDHWNGGLVVTGAPGVRKQYSADYVISDWVLAQGYAFAATDKGNTGSSFFENGKRSAPGQAVLEWHDRVTELARAAKTVVAQRYGRAPARTYMTGISNGGYLTRWQLEHHPELYDGGVDWEGTLFLANGPNLFTYLPTALKNYPKYAATGDQAAHDAMIAAGFAPGSEPLWLYHYLVYWDLTQRVYREEFDPGYDGATKAGYAFCPGGAGIRGCDADYDYASRPQAVKDAVGSVSLTGRIGRPMLTLHGDLDALLPIRTDSDVYTRMIRDAGRGSLSRYYVIGGGTHVDSLYDEHQDLLRPILPCYRAAFTAMTRWVETGAAPPRSQTVPKPTSGDVANTCPQLSTAAAPAGRATGSGGQQAGSGSNGPNGSSGQGAGSGSTTSGSVASGSRQLAATGPAPVLPGAALVLVAIGGVAATLARRRA